MTAGGVTEPGKFKVERYSQSLQRYLKSSFDEDFELNLMNLKREKYKFRY